MTLTIPDDVAEQIHMGEHDLLVELACFLFDQDRLSKAEASRMVNLSRSDFEVELIKRKMSVIHYTEQMLEQDLQTLSKLEPVHEHRGE